jgi:hypothetical protein
VIALNVVVLIMPRLPTFSPNCIAASSLEASRIPIPSYFPNVQYDGNWPPTFSASLGATSSRPICPPDQKDISLCIVIT